MIRVNGKNLRGKISSIPSKSYAHRALIGGALSDGISKIRFDRSSDDIDYTISSLKSLGAKILPTDYGVEVHPIEKVIDIPSLDVGESGTTFRLILPVATSIYHKCKFTGREGLARRPIIHLMEAMKKRGVGFDSDRLPFTTDGNLKSGEFHIPGDISSQYISGLLFATPLLGGKSEIILTSKLESKAYIDISIDVLKNFGINIELLDNGYRVEGQKYKSVDYKIEGDWSNAGFFLVAGALGQSVSMTGLNMNSVQGDMKIVEVLKNLGAKIEITKETISVSKDKLIPLEVDLSQIPDSLPILAIAATGVNGGVSRFYNGKRLRYKESDRLRSVATIIRDLGGRVEEKEEEILIYGTGGLKGGITSSFGDHRLVMAASIGSLISKEDVIIRNPEAVTKSYPDFFEDFKKLGGEIIG